MLPWNFWRRMKSPTPSKSMSEGDYTHTFRVAHVKEKIGPVARVSAIIIS
jgi:hypothetical protein